ncbi:hypothetical protein E2C01_036837 [Portunus trituberculatus]|uniref:Secreted protein n=1 Tax=Portunus trituberculatus TaxID=210409 RepID=A0A5B7FCB2_PORTR|nr:hypothetical protein [Portunus trituberculatus]
MAVVVKMSYICILQLLYSGYTSDVTNNLGGMIHTYRYHAHTVCMPYGVTGKQSLVTWVHSTTVQVNTAEQQIP